MSGSYELLRALVSPIVAVTTRCGEELNGLIVNSALRASLSPEKLRRLGEAVRARARDIAASTRTTIDLKPASLAPPASANPAVQGAIERAAASLRLTTMRLPSGAGHDAQMMAQLAPMGMIFVPSIGGISHSPKELTHWDDCARGANVLLSTVLEMDRL